MFVLFPWYRKKQRMLLLKMIHWKRLLKLLKRKKNIYRRSPLWLRYLHVFNFVSHPLTSYPLEKAVYVFGSKIYSLGWNIQCIASLQYTCRSKCRCWRNSCVLKWRKIRNATFRWSSWGKTFCKMSELLIDSHFIILAYIIFYYAVVICFIFYLCHF